MRPTNNHHNLILCLSLLCAVGMGCKSTSSPEETKGDAAVSEIKLNSEQINQLGITTTEVKEQLFYQPLRLSGLVEAPPQNLVSVSFPLPGYLKSTHLLAGMLVKKGEIIAWLEDMGFITLQQDYLSHHEKLTWLKAEYERQLALKTENANADKQFQLAKSDYLQEQVLVNALQEKLGLLGIQPGEIAPDHLLRSIPLRSPINGYVSKVLVNTGKYVQPQDVLFELVNPEDLHLMLTVYEKDMNRIQIGQKVEAHLIGQTTPLKARIILVTRNLDAQRRGEVHCHFDQEYAGILPGMYLEARVQTDSSLKWVLPSESVVRNDGKHWVFANPSSGVFQPMEVSVETESEGWWVLNDTSAQLLRTKKIVAHGAFGLLGVLRNSEEE